MIFPSTSPDVAKKLDQEDDLSHFRDQFVIEDPNLIYLDGNSLGRLPIRTMNLMGEVIEKAWGNRLIRSWNEGWIDVPMRLGAKIAQLIGAQDNEVLVTDSTSTNLFKLVIAALRSQSNRNAVLSDVLNFPSDLHILEGAIDLLGAGHKLRLIPSQDGISISSNSLEREIDDKTALVCLTHVAFKSAYMYDLARVTELAQNAGALMLWDLSHSVGAVPINMAEANVDLAVGCTYKYLNGGPGSPAFLYIRHDLQEQLMQPIWGWFASQDPFAFNLSFSPSSTISRFRVGTMPMLSALALEPGLDLIIEVGIDRLREKSVHQTEYLIYLSDQWLAPLGVKLGSPRDASVRGSHVALRHPESFRICRALIESPPPEIQVIPDFRAPDCIRLGIAPIYTSYTDIHIAIARIREIIEDELYLHYTDERQAVT